MDLFRTWIFLSFFLCCAACSPNAEDAVSTADIIFVGENIITMDDSNVEAVAVIGDRIAATGSAEEILAFRAETTRLVELGERALLPGFIDAHGHLGGVARNVALVNLSSPPVGPVENIDDIVALLREHIADEEVEAGEWVFGYGYDDSLIAEKRHPNRDDLDRVSLDHPIVLEHVSVHLATGNSAALAAGNVTANTADPAGGVIRRRAGTNEPNGVMEETAMSFYPSRSFGTDEARQRELLREAVQIYASYGVTTIQDGAASASSIEQMRSEQSKARLLQMWLHSCSLILSLTRRLRLLRTSRSTAADFGSVVSSSCSTDHHKGARPGSRSHTRRARPARMPAMWLTLSMTRMLTMREWLICLSGRYRCSHTPTATRQLK